MSSLRKYLLIIISIIMVLNQAIFVVNADNKSQELWTDVADTKWYDEHKTDDKYYISTAEELAGLAKLSISPTGGHLFAKDDDHVNFLGKTIELANNIDLNGRIWVPIGGIKYPDSRYPFEGTNVPFRGTFDGNEYSISNADIYFDAGDETDRLIGHGLFGYVEGATIQNLTLKNSKVTHINKSMAVTPFGIGLLVGIAESVTIDNVSLLSNTIESNCNINSQLAIGGFVGNEYKALYHPNYLLTKGVIVKNSKIDYLTMDVNVFTTTTGGRNVMIGGTVGSFAFASEIQDEPNFHSGINNTVIKNLDLSVTSSGDSDGLSLYVGGLVGLIYRKANIINNTIESNIDLSEIDKVDTASHGGIVGFITHAYSTGNSSIVSNTVKETLSTDLTAKLSIIGGIVGQNGQRSTKAISITDCSSSIMSSNRLEGNNVLTGNVVGYWDTRSNNITNNVYNNISNNNFVSKDSKYNLTGQLLKNNGINLDDNISKNWVLETNTMKTLESDEPITYTQVQEKTKEESIFNHYKPEYKAGFMDTDNNDSKKVIFNKAGEAVPLTIKLNPVNTNYISHTFNKNIKVLDNAGNINGNVDVGSSLVKIYHGNDVVAETTTDANGDYSFKNIAYGIYNLEVSNGNRVIVKKVNVNQSNIVENIVLPNEDLNTVIKENDANVVVDGIYENFTQEDKDEVANNKNMKIVFSAEKVENTQEANKIIETAPKDIRWEQFIDMNLAKEKYENDVLKETLELRELTSPLEIFIPIPKNVMNSKELITLYRYHLNSNNEIEIEELPNNIDGDEGFVFVDDYILLKSAKFSTYAIATKQKEYEVKYQFIGDVPSSAVLPKTELIKNDAKLAEPQVASVKGYQFKGWYEDDKSTLKYDFNQTINDNKVLYGLWEKEKVEEIDPVLPEVPDKPGGEDKPEIDQPNIEDKPNQDNPNVEEKPEVNAPSHVETSDNSNIFNLIFTICSSIFIYIFIYEKKYFKYKNK